jgi:hypothetical protein
MNKKPVAPIKTLARYEPEAVYIGAGEYIAECIRADDGDYYLVADVDAEIKALRAEIEWLRKALAEIRYRSSMDWVAHLDPFTKLEELGNIHQIADDALRKGNRDFGRGL